MLQTKKVMVNDEEYSVTEIRIRDMLPILPCLQGEPEVAQEAQLDMLKLCIMKDGKTIGDAVLDLSMKSYLLLATEVMEINGLEVGEQGKDLPHTNTASTQ